MIRDAGTVLSRRPRRLFVGCLAAGLLAAATSDPAAVSPNVVISQVYGGGGNSGATYRNDFVELFNRGTTPVSLAGWSIQYASATGTGSFAMNAIATLSGSLAPGQYYLVQLASGGATGALLPTADATGTQNMSATGGKVALVTTTSGLACNGSPTACSGAQLAQIVDLVGWDGATFFEGAAAAPTASNTTAVIRAAGGCTDTDNNGADYALGTPAPRNSTSPFSPCGADVPPSVSSTVPSSGAANIAQAANVAITFSEPVTADAAAFAISCTASGTHSFVLDGGPTLFTLNPDADFASSETCTITIRAAQVTDQDAPPQAMAADMTFSFSTIEACGDPKTPIHTIQGSDLQSALVGQTLSIEGIVTADYQGAGQFGGYFVQEEPSGVDADPTTSEGLFVFSTAFQVNVGDKVRVRGTVFEFPSSGGFLTELTSVAGVLTCSTGNTLPSPSVVALPVPSVAAWEQYEGMLVHIPQTLTVTETFTLARFGELALSAGGRLPQPTNVVAPGAPATARQALNDRSRIVLDDTNNQQNIDPTRYPAGGLSASNTVRVGDTVNPLTGVLDERFGVYRIQPVGTVVINPIAERPATPGPVGGTIKLASFNVLNYFNGDGLGGGFPTPRGATTPAEFARQRAKTIAAIATLDADVVGLMELENDASGNSALEDLVSGLNAAIAAGTYAFIDTGIVGTDEIRVGLIYKPATVTPYHGFAVLDSGVDPTFIDTKNRPSLAQSFTQNSNGKRLTVVVNHLKSKGSDCVDVGDPDIGDGQGNCNVTRTKAARALVNWLATDPTSAGDPDILVIGDMNSYALEDPIGAIASAGYVDLVGVLAGPTAYSYVFEGQSGYLDHALASAALAPRVRGVVEWHINADEPVALDYNVEFKSPNHVNTLYAPDPFRSSDHDPVVVGINLIQPFDWSGFFNPPSTLTLVHAGRTVPLKFGLGGNRGLNIFSAGSPSSRQIPCEGAPSGDYVPTVTAGESGLTYDSQSERYTYTWKTQKEWAGTCRELVVELADGTSHSATFAFTQ
jgi:predicted extracellular nuclease